MGRGSLDRSSFERQTVLASIVDNNQAGLIGLTFWLDHVTIQSSQAS
jgi:hypothetical protein